MRSTFLITTVCVDKFSFVHLRKTFVLFFPGHHRTQKEEMLTELVFGLSALLSGLQTASSSITTGEYECRIQGHGSPSLLSTRVLLQCPRSSRTLKKDTEETLGRWGLRTLFGSSWKPTIQLLSAGFPLSKSSTWSATKCEFFPPPLPPPMFLPINRKAGLTVTSSFVWDDLH